MANNLMPGSIKPISTDAAADRCETGVTPSLIYLNSARVSPSPRPTIVAIKYELEREYREGWKGGELKEVMEKARAGLARCSAGRTCSAR